MTFALAGFRREKILLSSVEFYLQKMVFSIQFKKQTRGLTSVQAFWPYLPGCTTTQGCSRVPHDERARQEA
jgi:hypothetical protein